MKETVIGNRAELIEKKNKEKEDKDAIMFFAGMTDSEFQDWKNGKDYGKKINELADVLRALARRLQ